MTINIKENGDIVEIEVSGVIKGTGHSQSIKDAINSIEDPSKAIHLNIQDSFAITSTIIGYLRKKVQVDGIKLQVNVKDERLLELMEELNLTRSLNVHKM